MDHPKVPIHGDLWYENLLIDTESGRLTGVVDFDQASIGDPAWDLATQLHCGREFAEQVFDAYPLKDPAMWWRAEKLFALRPFEALEWSLQRRNAVEFEDSLRKLYLVGVLPDTGMIRRTTAPWLGTSAE
jgi:aminoglycoside phosphotransferase (APT) family kinase protein